MTQAQSKDFLDISSRLRFIREERGATTQRLADITGISKRTLESYMLKENAPLPGLDALRKISDGLEISLDWLVFGVEKNADTTTRIVRLVSYNACIQLLATIIDEEAQNGADYLSRENWKIGGKPIDQIARDFAMEAGGRAAEIVAQQNDTAGLIARDELLAREYQQDNSS